TISDSYDSEVGFEPTPPPQDGEDTGADPLIGLVVADRYRILERIGRGGMGIVYRVEHTRIAKLLAMKLLAGELSANKEVVRRFKQEAMVVSKLSNPNTVQVFDYGVWNHLTYLVMEIVEGYDLARPLRTEGPMPFARLGKLMVQVCNSLAEAHEKGIVHRDIKPENIMIVADSQGVETAKVLDFGLAKLREGKELNEVTLQGAVIGTPYYMSPEQVTGDEVDGRTDIYSLGTVMFRAITGTQAFQSATPMGMFTKHLTAPVPSAKERRKKLEIPDGVSDLIEVCMAKDPADRIQTVEELRDRLIEELTALGLPSSEQLVISGERPSLAGRTSSPGGPRKPKRPDRKATDMAMTQVATRRELEAYERKLRRTRYGAWALLAAVLVGGGVSAGYALRATKSGFESKEKERNDSAAQANALRLGGRMAGKIGERPEKERGDRDFYAFEVPGGDGEATHVSLRTTALPNFPTCSILYRVGFEHALAQYCTGRAGQDLVVAALSLEPGAYLVAVVQDRNPYGGGRIPFVLENVTHDYELAVALATPKEGEEIEPNDVVELAQKLPAGGVMVGTLAWVGDEDVYCLDPDPEGPVTWQVDDGERAKGTVLEVTPLHAGVPGPVVRVHGAGTKPFGRPRLEADVNSPWVSPPLQATPGGRCLRLRLTTDPWFERSGQEPPATEPTEYHIKAMVPQGG
ncbi:MAG: serine/threonine protein kinase, partial [Deltaproteobacteria bacterium]|nr:serine/threonine protein kinase [Deltaproteobacteria bacterium]